MVTNVYIHLLLHTAVPNQDQGTGFEVINISFSALSALVQSCRTMLGLDEVKRCMLFLSTLG